MKIALPYPQALRRWQPLAFRLLYWLACLALFAFLSMHVGTYLAAVHYVTPNSGVYHRFTEFWLIAALLAPFHRVGLYVFAAFSIVVLSNAYFPIEGTLVSIARYVDIRHFDKSNIDFPALYIDLTIIVGVNALMACARFPYARLLLLNLCVLLATFPLAIQLHFLIQPSQ